MFPFSYKKKQKKNNYFHQSSELLLKLKLLIWYSNGMPSRVRNLGNVSKKETITIIVKVQKNLVLYFKAVQMQTNRKYSIIKV